jgi:hypothetical protein
LEYVHIQPRSENLLLALGKALEFSAADLLENRVGKLGQLQFSRLARGRVISSLVGVLISLVTPILLRIGWLLAVEERSIWRFFLGILSDPSTILRQSTGPIEEPIPYLFWLVLAIFPLITMNYLLRVPWQLFLDLVNRKVLCETGLTTHRWDERRTRSRKGREGDLISSYSYVVNGKRFRVNRAAFEALAPSLEYNLYYLPLSQIVVSMEPLEAAKKDFDPASKGFDLLNTAKKSSR